MAEYCKPIEKSFVCRTNKLIQEYNGRYDATMLLNCLLGLLIVPFEKYNNYCRDEERTSVIRGMFDQLQAEGRYDSCGYDYDDFGILRCLRNAIAHFHVESIADEGVVTGFRFLAFEMDKYCSEQNGVCQYKNIPSETQKIVFDAKLSIANIKELASYIKNFVLELEENRRCRKCDYRNRY